jgi:hypothetical protein
MRKGMNMDRPQTASAATTSSAAIAINVAQWSLWITGFFIASAILVGLLISSLWFLVPSAKAAEAVVYSVYQGVDLGEAPVPSDAPETKPAPKAPIKDFFINVGSSQGIKPGTVLEVSRKMPTYDLLGEKLYKEIVFPIGTIKVIHVEQGVAIARLDAMLPSDKTPAFSPRAIMVGDLVRKAD